MAGTPDLEPAANHVTNPALSPCRVVIPLSVPMTPSGLSRLSRRRSLDADNRQGQFLLPTAQWGGRAGLVLVAGEEWRTSQPEPEPESESQSQEKAGGREALALAPAW